MRRGWYEKYIGYCFNDDGREAVLDDVWRFENGRLCFQMHYPETGEYQVMDYKSFMEIRKQTVLPR